MISDEEVRARFGPDAIVSRKGDFMLVHLDSPDVGLIRERTREFDPKDYFEDDCPLCAMQRASGIVIFDSFPSDDEEILLE